VCVALRVMPVSAVLVRRRDQEDLTQDIYAEMPLNLSRCAVAREREPTRSQRASSFATEPSSLQKRCGALLLPTTWSLQHRACRLVL
jgi:hypothetical protein